MTGEWYKQKFGGMNLDKDVRRLQPGEYRMLTNGIPVQSRLSSEPGVDGNIANIVGNTAATAATAYLPTGGTNRVVGSLEDRVGDRAFWFVANTTPDYDSIYQYTTSGGIVLIMRNTLLGLSSATFVSADIVGDLLTYTTNLGDIIQINIADAIAGGIYTPLLNEIALIRMAPQAPLTLTPTGTSRSVNNIRYNTFQFYHRLVYRDNAYSPFGPVSQAVQSGATIDAIDVVTATAGIPATATKIEYGFKINGGNELTIYRSDDLPLSSSSHRFYNDTNLETVPDAEAVKWYDSVPLKAKALKFHENRLFAFGNTEGYTLTGAQLTGATAGITAGTGHVLKDDSVYGVAVQFHDWAGRIIGARKVGDVTVTRRNSGTGSLPSNKILVDLSAVATANIPSDAYSFSVLRTKNKSTSFFISSVSADVFYRTVKSDETASYDKTFASSFEQIYVDLTNLLKLEMGYTFSEGDRLKLWRSDGTTVLDLPITGQEGHYIIATHSEVTTATADLDATTADVLIFEIYTPKAAGLDLYYEVGHRAAINSPGTGSRAFASTSIIIPGDVYIASRTTLAGTSTAGTGYYIFTAVGYSPTDPDANTYSVRGSWQRPTTGGITFPDQFYSLAVESKSPNWATWADDVGRSVLYNADGSQQIEKKTIRFSNEYIENSRILGVNTFEALNEQALPADNGTPYALAPAEDILVAIFDIEAIALYIGQGFVNTSDGNQFLAKSDQVIGDDRRYSGSFGTMHPSTVITRSGRVYWLDFKKQVVIRRAQDGLTVISDYGISALIATLCEAYASVSASNSRISAGWDPQYECYTLCFYNLAAPTIEDSMTLYFHEKTNHWTCRSDLRPEFFGILFNKQFHFLSGALWIQATEAQYNKFFNTQYNRTLAIEIAPQESLEKIWEAIEVDAESIYVTAGTNEDIVLLYQLPGGTLENRINYLDFRLRGSAWRSSFFRNLNDANFSSVTESKYKSAHNTRGQSAYISITYNGTDRNPMKSISVFYRPSLNTTP